MSKLESCPMCQGRVHQFEDNKWGCEKCLRIWNDEGGGEWVSDVRKITMEELHQLMGHGSASKVGRREINVADGWINYLENPPHVNEMEVIGYSPAWIHPDFNPKGTRVGFRNDDNTFTCARWNDEQDEYIADSSDIPLFWKPIY